MFWRNNPDDEMDQLDDLYRITLDSQILEKLNTLREMRGLPPRDPYISIYDIVISTLGPKESYTAEDFDNLGLAMLSGCERCQETLGPGNAYPSKSGYIRCEACLGDLGYRSVSEFEAARNSINIKIDEVDNIKVECQNCGAWCNQNQILDVGGNYQICADCAKEIDRRQSSEPN